MGEGIEPRNNTVVTVTPGRAPNTLLVSYVYPVGPPSVSLPSSHTGTLKEKTP